MVEVLGQKSLERAVSQRALQMGNYFPCQICVVGFLCGVCLTSLFLAFFNSVQLGGGFAISTLSSVVSNPSSRLFGIVTRGDCDSKTKRQDLVRMSSKYNIDMQMSMLYSSWSSLLHKSDHIDKKILHRAPHLEDCNTRVEMNRKHDGLVMSHSLPPWSLWRGLLKTHFFASNAHFNQDSYPPWVEGSDEENHPLTRKVQRDIWIHQHPINCKDPSVRFLIADWERLPGFGIGAQIAGMSGLLAIAINEKRVLVTNFYNRADHDGCKGQSRSHWSCYFLLETSHECQDHAFSLMDKMGALEKGLITKKENYTSKEIWSGKIPKVWGTPWNFLLPTTEINGSLVANHRRMDQRWWRAQAVRYLMRFQTEYTCGLMNLQRHAAFGREAAKMVIQNGVENSQGDMEGNGMSGMEEFVWSSHKPWIPRPLLSMHVRMGDKACEMEVVEFEHYMRLANRIRIRFPHLKTIWLSTEMQSVIEKSKAYPDWKFYYTEVRRQEENVTMASYEASLGRENSTNYPLVNLLMASEADFFVGALGSSWCYLIDGMRNTGGKVMAGYLSVNKDRFW